MKHDKALEILREKVADARNGFRFYRGEVEVTDGWIKFDESKGRTPEKAHVERRDRARAQAHRLGEVAGELEQSIKVLEADQ